MLAGKSNLHEPVMLCEPTGLDREAREKLDAMQRLIHP